VIGCHCNHSVSILIDLAVDLRHDCEEKMKVREHGREGKTMGETLRVCVSPTPVINPVNSLYTVLFGGRGRRGGKQRDHRMYLND